MARLEKLSRTRNFAYIFTFPVHIENSVKSGNGDLFLQNVALVFKRVLMILEDPVKKDLVV